MFSSQSLEESPKAKQDRSMPWQRLCTGQCQQLCFQWQWDGQLPPAAGAIFVLSPKGGDKRCCPVAPLSYINGGFCFAFQYLTFGV